MRASILLTLGAAALVLGSPVPQVRVWIGIAGSMLISSEQEGNGGVLTTATYSGVRVYETLVSYSPWLVEATTEEVWTVTETVFPGAPTPI